jgi:hypothetical protein
MDSDSELKALARRLHIPLVWIGNKDNLPHRLEQGAYIANLQDDQDSDGNDLPGTHWTAFLVDNRQTAYSDSFGFPPPAQVQQFLRPLRPYSYTSHQIQNTQSGHCGRYAIFFLYYMFSQPHTPMDHRLDSYMSLWSSDPTKNLKLLDSYMAAALKKYRASS